VAAIFPVEKFCIQRRDAENAERSAESPWQGGIAPLAQRPAAEFPQRTHPAVPQWNNMKHIVVLLAAAAVMPDLNQLKQMTARFAPVDLKYDAASLSDGDRRALPKLVEAARVLNHLFMDQLWSGNRELYTKLL
jgi:hypothetical protein